MAARHGRKHAQLDEWAREVRRATSCRRWFDHDPARFAEFRARYRGELAAQRERVEKLRARTAQTRPVTILYAARDREHNNAVVLAELLRTGEG